MELYQLRYFTEIAKHHSYTKAAENLSVTQPTLSIAIKKLEAELNVSLFRKDGKATALTDEGTALAPVFAAVLADVDLAVRTAEDLNRTAVSRVRLGLPQMACDDLLIAVKDFFSQRSGVSVSISQLRFEELRARLLEETLDLGIILKPDGESEADRRTRDSLDYIPYGTVSLAAFVSKKHRFSRYDYITPEMLNAEKLLISGMDEGVSRVVINYMKAEVGGDFEPEVGDYIDLHTTLRLAEGYGVALFPENIEIDENVLQRVPLRPAPELHLVIARPRAKKQTPLQRELTAFIKEFK